MAAAGWQTCVDCGAIATRSTVDPSGSIVVNRCDACYQRTKGAIAMEAQNPTKTVGQTDMLRAAMRANRPVLLMGAPGTAKTATIEAIAAEDGAYLEVLIASAQDPTTILGIPMPSEDRKHTEATVPGWARRLNDAHANGRPTILFVDELTTVPPSVAAPLLGIVQSRRADGWTLPADTRIVAAANPPDLAVGGWALDPAMANRWVHVKWDAPRDEWVAWARTQDSPTLRDVATFVESVPDMLLSVPMRLDARSGPWPSPRSWTNGAAMVDATGVPDVIAAAVGESAAVAFLAWLQTRDVPSPDDLIAGRATLPERLDAFRTAVDGLAAAADRGNVGRVFEVLATGVGTDPYVIGRATAAIARRGLVAGIAPLASALTAAGVDLAALSNDEGTDR